MVALLLVLLVDLALKGAIILAIVWSITLLARHASAATLHRVWLSGFAGLLLIVIARLALPPIETPLLPDVSRLASSHGRSARQPFVRPAASDVTNALWSPEATASAHPVGSPSQANARSVLDASRWQLLVVTIWLGGAALVIIRLLTGAVMVRRHTRRLHPAERATDAEVQALARKHGIRRKILVLIGDDSCVPATWGIRSPVLLLPADITEWAPARRLMVLQHELAHVSRHDPLTRQLSELMAAFCWFQPLVWLALRRAHYECERACDDVVLTNGVPAAAYASTLLAVATGMGRSPTRTMSFAGVTGRTDIERRIRAVLAGTPRRPSPPRFWSAGFTMALGGIVPFAMLSPVRTGSTAMAPTTLVDLQDWSRRDGPHREMSWRQRIESQNRRGGLALVMEDRRRLRTDAARRDFWLGVLANIRSLSAGDLSGIADASLEIRDQEARAAVLTMVLRRGGADVAGAVCGSTSGLQFDAVIASLVKEATHLTRDIGTPRTCLDAIAQLGDDEAKASMLFAILRRQQGGARFVSTAVQTARTIRSPELRASVLAVARTHPAVNLARLRQAAGASTRARH